MSEYVKTTGRDLVQDQERIKVGRQGPSPLWCAVRTRPMLVLTHWCPWRPGVRIKHMDLRQL
jgi:hypothetical protein